MIIMHPRRSTCLRGGCVALNSGSVEVYPMTEKIEQCHCEKCGNEAEMVVTCQMIEVETPSGETKKNNVKPAHAKYAGTKRT